MSHEEAFSFDQMGEGFLRHAQRPLGLGKLANPQGLATGVGQCGDSVEVGLRVVGETIDAIGVVPKGCVYTLACASALVSLVKGLTVEEALRLDPRDIEKELGGLPEDHVHCARLAVNTLGEAIEEYLRQQGPTRLVAASERSDS